MQKQISGAILVLAALILPSRLAAIEIRGKVIEVNEGTIKITTDSDLVPNIGDKVEIIFEVPGIEKAAHIADADVSQIGDDFILAKIEKAKGKVVRNLVATIRANNPRKRSQAVPTGSGQSTVRQSPAAAGPEPMPANQAGAENPNWKTL